MRIILLLLTLALLSACSTCCEENKHDNDTVVRSDRTLSQAARDLKISSAIHTSLAALDLYKPIDVNVIGGKVILTGSVASPKDRLAATGIAWNQPGVKAVINDLIVDPKRHDFNAKQYAKDAWITATIKAKAVKDPAIKSANYTIVTTHNIVYLFGVARSLEELDKLESISKEVNGVKNVVSHVRIQNQ